MKGRRIPAAGVPVLFRFILCIFITGLLYLPSSSLSQNTTGSTSQGQTDEDETRVSETTEEPTETDFNARSLSVRDVDGERVIEGVGDVKIVRGDVTITGDRARNYRRRQLTYLLGNVHIYQRGLHMEGDEGEYRALQEIAILRRNVRIDDRGTRIRCDEARYNRITERAWLRGNVVVVDSSTTLTADSLFYDKHTLVSEAFGDVRIIDVDEDVQLDGRHGFYYKETGQGMVDEQPRLTVDPESNQPTTVVSDTMRFYPDDKVAIAYRRVKILKGSTVTQCDSAVVIDQSKRVELYGNPLAKQGNTSMQGDLMLLGYDEEEINQIKIVGQAMIKETPKDSLVVDRDSWVKGDSMVLFLRENTLDSIQVSGTCESEYYPAGVGRVESNYAAGDSMYFVFVNDSLTYVKIVGQASGVYRYVDLDHGETADSLRALSDTSLTFVRFADEANRVVYSSDTIQYYAKNRDLVLNKKAKVDYQGKTLIGDDIIFSADLQLMEAVGSPVLIEGADKLYGDGMSYDMDSGTGLVQDGSTKFMDGYYKGEMLAKVGDDVLKVWNSTYTTCDLKVPHYHVDSNRMKVYLDDKVVTGPLVLRIGETPIFALPFFSENIRRGRRSGILRPVFEFGITSQRDRFIRNIGYYWATNDYTDFTFSGDFNENRSLRFYINNRYKLRYVFDGGFKLSLYRDMTDYTNEWTFSGNHSHNLGEKASFNANLKFVSSDQAPKAVSQLDQVADVIDRRIESTLSLRKSWSAMGFSASARRKQILDVTNPKTVKLSMTLPSIALSIPSRTLYFGEKRKRGYETITQKILDKVRYSPGLSMNRTVDEREYDWTETVSAKASLGLTAPFKLAFFNVSPSLSANDSYTRIAKEVWADTLIDDSTEPPDTTILQRGSFVESDNVLNWNTGVGVSTNLYGTFYPRIGALRGIRHTLTPAASYSYTPSLRGRPSSQRVNVSLKNAIDLKVLSGERQNGRGENTELGEGGDTEASEEIEEETRKLSGVVLWTLSSSYNPDAPAKSRWSTISSLVNLRVLGTNLSLTQSIDPYEWEILSTRLSSSLTFRGHHPFGTAAEVTEEELNLMAADTSDADTDLELEEGGEFMEEDTEEEGLPWHLSAAFSYSKSSGYGEPSSTLNLDGGISLTRAWRIVFRTQYNVVDRSRVGDYFGITRDLHCWEMSLGRQKLADEWEFYFRINIKAHPEVYAEDGNRGLGGGTFGSPFDY